MKNGCKPTRSAWKRWTAFPCTFVWAPWKRQLSTRCPPTIMAAKWIGTCSRRRTTQRRWNPTLFGATRWKSAYWRGEFQSAAMRIIWNFRKCWPRPPISGKNSRYRPEVHERRREPGPAPERATPSACVPDGLFLLCSGLRSGMRGALDTFCNPQDHQCQLQQDSRDKNSDKQRHDPYDQVDQPVRGRLLITEHDTSHNQDPAEDDAENVQELYDAASELVLKREVEESRKEILFFGHAASLAHKSIAIAGIIQLVRQIRAGSQASRVASSHPRREGCEFLNQEERRLSS